MCTWPSGPAWNMHMAWCGRRRTVGIWWGRLWGTIGIQPSILRILLLLRLLLALWVHSPPIFHIWDRLGQSSSAVESGIGRRPDLFFFLINSLVETNLWQGCGWKLPTMKWMGTSYNDAHLSYVFKKKKMKMNENTSWHDVDVYCSGRYLKIAVPSLAMLTTILSQVARWQWWDKAKSMFLFLKFDFSTLVLENSPTSFDFSPKQSIDKGLTRPSLSKRWYTAKML